MIQNIRKSPLCLSFDGKFQGMRKAQDFVVYPTTGDAKNLVIQSDTRIGYIDLTPGDVSLSPSHPSGAYFPHLKEAKKVGVVSVEQLNSLEKAK